MRITKENLKDNFIINDSKEFVLLVTLLDDLQEINDKLKNKLYIDIQDYHNVYSPERTDPCPDYYAYYSIRCENNPSEVIGDYYSINDLDNAMLLLNDFIRII